MPLRVQNHARGLWQHGLMDLTQLRQFLAIAERGSFSQAARVLGVSQPGLTRSMRRLENELDAPLLSRRPRGVELTEAGAALQRHAQAVQIQLVDAVQEVASLAHRRDALVRVGAGPSWLTHLLPTVVARAVARDPTLRIQVSTGQADRLFASLRQGQLDVVLGAMPEGAALSGLTFVELTRDDVRVVARRGHRLAGKRQISLEALTHERWVLAGPEMFLRRRLVALLESHGLSLPAPTIEADSTLFILAIVQNSDLLGITTSDMLRSTGARGIVALDVRYASMVRPTGIVRRAKTVLSAAAEEFVAAFERAACAEAR
jgi:DNA-binding transcriptional LysR family regulator